MCWFLGGKKNNPKHPRLTIPECAQLQYILIRKKKKPKLESVRIELGKKYKLHL